MPPKQSKADVAKKQKVVEDKTFGLKNKNKSKNVQKYVQQIQQSAVPKPDPSKLAAKKKKDEEKAREKELNDLFKIAVVQPKVPPGVDPKSILCEFFKAGQCAKGFKCKFSHDLNVQRKGEKIDIFSDTRDEGTMEDWDLETLAKVVESKGKEYNQNKPTDIVYFLSSSFVAHLVYAFSVSWLDMWFANISSTQWRKSNMVGSGCVQMVIKSVIIDMILPPGYILKSQMKALLEEEANKLAIEDEIEDQRAKVKTTTPMTTDLFMGWKKKKMDEKEAGMAVQRAERAKNDRMSGRELFLADASLFVDDAEAYEKYHREEEPENSNQKAQESSSTSGPSTSTSVAAVSEEGNSDIDDDDDDLDMDELNELEASLSRTSIQIKEPEK
ncbi:zinc finger CCCH domain-containing protein 11-like protein [Tanacetum coccineum]